MLKAPVPQADAAHLYLHLIRPTFPGSVSVDFSLNAASSQIHLSRDPCRSLLDFLPCSHRYLGVLQVQLHSPVQREMSELIMNQRDVGCWLCVKDEHLNPMTEPARKPPMAEFQLSSFSLRFAEASFPNSYVPPIAAVLLVSYFILNRDLMHKYQKLRSCSQIV